MTADHPHIAGWLLIAAPLRVVDATAMTAAQRPEPKRFVTGAADHLAPPSTVTEHTARWANTTVETVESADHFFAGHLDRVTTSLTDLIDGLPLAPDRPPPRVADHG